MMRSVRRVILRALVIAAFTGLTIGGSLRVCSADGGMDSGAGGMGNQEVPGTIQEDTGSGAGGSTDTGTGTDTGYGRGSGIDSGTGYGTGGSTESGTGGTSGSGTGGYTVTNPSDSNKNDSGTVRGGVFYPDYSNELGAGHNAGSDDNR
jgi:hypothetical protein